MELPSEAFVLVPVSLERATTRIGRIRARLRTRRWTMKLFSLPSTAGIPLYIFTFAISIVSPFSHLVSRGRSLLLLSNLSYLSDLSNLLIYSYLSASRAEILLARLAG